MIPPAFISSYDPQIQEGLLSKEARDVQLPAAVHSSQLATDGNGESQTLAPMDQVGTDFFKPSDFGINS